MKLLLCLVLTLWSTVVYSTAPHTPQPCCLPGALEFLAAGHALDGHLDMIEVFASYSLDFKNLRQAYNRSVLIGRRLETVSIIILNETRYLIQPQEKTCVKITNAKYDLTRCIPHDYVYTGLVTLGGSLPVVGFRNVTRHFYSLIHVTPKTCIPVREVWEQPSAEGIFSMELVFFNATTGIKDPTVFIPPSYCPKTATVEDVKNLPAFRKFTHIKGFML